MYPFYMYESDHEVSSQKSHCIGTTKKGLETRLFADFKDDALRISGRAALCWYLMCYMHNFTIDTETYLKYYNIL